VVLVFVLVGVLVAFEPVLVTTAVVLEPRGGFEDGCPPLFPFAVEESAWGFEIEAVVVVLLLEPPAGISGVAMDAKAEKV
jgi:hypothetical protein